MCQVVQKHSLFVANVSRLPTAVSICFVNVVVVVAVVDVIWARDLRSVCMCVCVVWVRFRSMQIIKWENTCLVFWIEHRFYTVCADIVHACSIYKTHRLKATIVFQTTKTCSHINLRDTYVRVCHSQRFSSSSPRASVIYTYRSKLDHFDYVYLYTIYRRRRKIEKRKKVCNLTEILTYLYDL